MARILIVDDETAIRDSLELILQYERHEIIQASDGVEALERIRESVPDLVLLDVVMPRKTGLEVLEHMHTEYPGISVIMISGHGDIPTAIAATQKGAFDFIDKPLERDRLLVSVRNALRHFQMRTEISMRYRIIGDSPAIRKMLVDVDRVAPKDAGVLITGENGTGKELVARRIHELSPRLNGPFVDVNCAAIPRELIESELFGHVKGAFTGADRDKPGKFEQADRGTLFLDEVGDMALDSQAKVLRVLEERKLQRVGGSRAISFDVRVLAATNKDLDEEVRENRFREDLYYRLNVVPIHVPPLRDRPEDIPALVQYFLKDACVRNGVHPPPEITGAAQKELRSNTWPGNVRELRNFIERLVILGSGPVLDAAEIQSFLHKGSDTVWDLIDSVETFEEFKERSEHLFLKRKLEAFGWNIKRTADALKMQRSNLYKKIDRFDMKKPEGGDPSGRGPSGKDIPGKERSSPKEKKATGPSKGIK